MSDNPLYDLAHQGESVQQGYDSFNRGTYLDEKGKQYMNPSGPDMDLSQMTVGDIQKLQVLNGNDPKRLFAVGCYQMITDGNEGGGYRDGNRPQGEIHTRAAG